MPGAERYFDVTCFKGYAIGSLIVMTILAGMDAYNRPGQDLRIGTIVAMSAVWPVTVAIVAGVSIGEVASDGWDVEKTAKRLEKS
jgi:hypothetical protein